MAGKYFTNKTILDIITLYENIWALSHLEKLANWDSEVYMPESGAKLRGHALAKIQILTKQLLTHDSFHQLLKNAEAENLNTYEEALLRVLKRELRFYERLPEEFLEEYEKTISEAQLAWRTAKKTNDYKIFEPFLQKIIDLSKKKAQYIGYKKHPYDALLDTFEEGSTVAKLDPYFQEVVGFIENILKNITSSKKYLLPSKIADLEYKRDSAIKLNHKLLEFLHYNPKRLRLDISSHPFSEGLSTDDSRITTRYEGKDIARTVTSTIHEFGHALYFLQHNSKFNLTPLYINNSLALHESQSRFFENHIGRSFKFLEKNLNLFKNLGNQYEHYNADGFYRYFNEVKPSLIRVEADELTYHLHIYIRYKIEKQLLEGELRAEDIPSYWNDLYTNLLGITPTDYSTGCLQDIHWSMGAIGYFPTYSQGTVFASQIAEELTRQIGSIDELLSKPDGVVAINEWLRKNIHTYGSVYTFDQLVKNLTGKDFQLNPWKNYLKEKYAKLY